jgi:hypothetical protein
LRRGRGSDRNWCGLGARRQLRLTCRRRGWCGFRLGGRRVASPLALKTPERRSAERGRRALERLFEAHEEIEQLRVSGGSGSRLSRLRPDGRGSAVNIRRGRQRSVAVRIFRLEAWYQAWVRHRRFTCSRAGAGTERTERNVQEVFPDGAVPPSRDRIRIVASGCSFVSRALSVLSLLAPPSAVQARTKLCASRPWVVLLLAGGRQKTLPPDTSEPRLSGRSPTHIY